MLLKVILLHLDALSDRFKKKDETLKDKELIIVGELKNSDACSPSSNIICTDYL